MKRGLQPFQKVLLLLIAWELVWIVALPRLSQCDRFGCFVDWRLPLVYYVGDLVAIAVAYFYLSRQGAPKGVKERLSLWLSGTYVLILFHWMTDLRITQGIAEPLRVDTLVKDNVAMALGLGAMLLWWTLEPGKRTKEDRSDPTSS